MSEAYDLNKLFTLVYTSPLQKLTLMVHSLLVVRIMKFDLKQAIGRYHVIVVALVDSYIDRLFVAYGFHLGLFVLAEDT